MAVELASSRYAAPEADRRLHAMIDSVRTTMEAEMMPVRDRCRTYLNWYSPPFNIDIGRHDAWEEVVDVGTDLGLTRDNFPISRSVVDIWTSLEAATPPTQRAEPEKIVPPPPELDQDRMLLNQQLYDILRTNESIKADMRSARIRRWMRKDKFALKHYTAVRRKNLYGFSWMKVLPKNSERRPVSHVVRNPTNVFPIWSSRDPDDIEAILCVYQENAVLASEKYDLGLQFTTDGKGTVAFDRGRDSGQYQDLNNRWYDSTRSMVWVEEFWWIKRDIDHEGNEGPSQVSCAIRVVDRIVAADSYSWKHIPFVYWQNTDERDSYGWSDIAGVIDINDEINRRVSQEGDVIGMFAAPRFQLLGALHGRNVEMPDAFELIELQDTERIEQILTRIDAFPAQQHFNFLFGELLPRVTGLPPVVWGLIQNAQTSGRALTASWKATETRLSPKLMRNEQSLDRKLAIEVDYARTYDWDQANVLFQGLGDRPYDDWLWEFPPMEPRDFQEVTMDAITRRDAMLTTTIRAIRDTGQEDAEDVLTEIRAENTDATLHPDKAQAIELLKRARLDNEAMQAQLSAPPPTPAGPPAGAPAQAVGGPPPTNGLPPGAQPGTLPPTQPGAPGNAGVPVPPGGGTVSTGTLFRNGDISNQFLAQGKI